MNVTHNTLMALMQKELELKEIRESLDYFSSFAEKSEINSKLGTYRDRLSLFQRQQSDYTKQDRLFIVLLSILRDFLRK